MMFIDSYLFVLHKFYKKILPSHEDPFLVSVLALSASLGNIIKFLIETFRILIFCNDNISSTIYFSFHILLTIVIAIRYYYNNGYEKFVKIEPVFFKNKIFNLIFFWSIFLFGITWFVWGADYAILLKETFCK